MAASNLSLRSLRSGVIDAQNLRLKGSEEKWSAIRPTGEESSNFLFSLFLVAIHVTHRRLLFHYIFRANRASRDNAVHTHQEVAEGGGATLIQGSM